MTKKLSANESKVLMKEIRSGLILSGKKFQRFVSWQSLTKRKP